ncbi:hypothetical protein LPJ59_006525, partial [Coemansia sp. RSA 2399]
VLCSGEYDYLHWSPDGTEVVIEDRDKVAANVLPTTFSTSKFKSFSRQLHLYGFSRTVDGRKSKDILGYTVFKHESFRRDEPGLVATLKRRQLSEKRFVKEKMEEFPKLVSRICNTKGKNAVNGFQQKKTSSSSKVDPLPLAPAASETTHNVSTVSKLLIPSANALEPSPSVVSFAVPQTAPLVPDSIPEPTRPQLIPAIKEEETTEYPPEFETADAKEARKVIQKLVDYYPRAHPE